MGKIDREGGCIRKLVNTGGCNDRWQDARTIRYRKRGKAHMRKRVQERIGLGKVNQ